MEPMNEATLKVSRMMQPIAGALQAALLETLDSVPPWVLIAFTAGRTSYVANVQSIAHIVEEVRRWHRYLASGERPADWEVPEPDDTARILAISLRQMAQEIETLLDEIAGEHVLFAFLIFPQGMAQYASNAERDGALKGIAEWLAYVDAVGDDSPNAHEYTAQ